MKLAPCEPIVPPIRRDIAAMTLALYAIRTWMTGGRAVVSDDYAEQAVAGAVECLDWGSAFCDDLIIAIPRTRGRGELRDPRLIRARLALLIRTVLRWESERWPERWMRTYAGAEAATVSYARPSSMILAVRERVPLYRQAPAYDGRTPKERRTT